MFRLLLLLVIAGVAAYFTNPAQDKHDAAARAAIEASAKDAGAHGNVLDEAAGYVKGAFAGNGRYENYYVASKYSLDMPGSSYVECYGAFTVVKCSVVKPGG
jgi:hypothetical protein